MPRTVRPLHDKDVYELLAASPRSEMSLHERCELGDIFAGLGSGAVVEVPSIRRGLPSTEMHRVPNKRGQVSVGPPKGWRRF